VNVYGDRHPWAPCIAQPAVRALVVELAAEAAARPGARGTELESCGWYGLAHLHAHDKIAGVGLGDAAQQLMSRAIIFWAMGDGRWAMGDGRWARPGRCR
jgi:hypothetical protein